MPDTPTTPAVPCRHCGDPLKRQEREGEHWTHAHGRYRCQRKVTYGHNAAHPDVPCVPGGPNPCKCTYDPDPEPRCSHYDDGEHRNTALVPASSFKCKCGYGYRGAARFA